MQKIVCLATLTMLCFATTVRAAEPQPTEEGFVPLFDCKTLDGWQGSVDGYQVEDGMLVCIPDKGGNLFTKNEFDDFILRFEFQLTQVPQ